MTNLVAGDRVAYTAKHLRNTGQLTGSASSRRGTYLRECSWSDNYCHVMWDDTDYQIANKIGDFVEPDYCEEIKKNGSPAPIGIICKIGSAKFACNDL
jgi:hypothetical protein